MKYLLLLLSSIILFLTFLTAEEANAQWAIGASYEVRDEDPTNGFGVRIERGFLNRLPVVDINIRAHFSFFSEENSLTSQGVTVNRDLDTYDYGLAAIGGISVGLVKPYIGVGIGAETFEFEQQGLPDEFSETNFYINGFGGAEFTLLPLVNPFIEYRFTRLTGTENVTVNDLSRLAIGVSLRF